MTSYNYTNGYAVLSYLEYPIILIQEYILIFLVLKYLNKINMWALVCSIIYFTLSSCLLFEIVPKVVLTLLAVSIPFAPKIPVYVKVKGNFYFNKCPLIVLAHVHSDFRFQQSRSITSYTSSQECGVSITPYLVYICLYESE